MPDSSFGHRPSDQRLSASLRRVVADEISEQRRLARADSGDRLDDLDERQMARAVLNREMDLRVRESLRLGEQPLADPERAELIEEVISQVFSPLPGLDRFAARDDVVNIHIQGCREVVVELLDGTIERHPSPFGSNGEVEDFLAQTARRAGDVENEFNYSHPILRLSLPDGSRLSANAWIGPEPYATIRKHPLIDRDLDGLQAMGMVDADVRSLVGAAVRAEWNIFFAGGQGNGKTTLLRAAAHEIHADTRVVTIEAIPELHLDRLPHRHNHVVVQSERPANMQGDGAVTAAHLAWHAKHLSPDRIIVGEVLADEVVPMLEAMSQGIRGAMCTMHATSSASVFPRLPVYARSAGRDWRSADIYELAAQAIDLVVFVARDTDRRRVVAEVRHVDRFDADTGRIVTDAWFTAHQHTGRATRTGVISVHLLDELVAHGYRPEGPRSMEAV
jgi:pilus assembly protein CpaF